MMPSADRRVAPVKILPARNSGSGIERRDRRSWLKTSGMLMGTLAAGSPLALLAPSLVWALPLQSLNEPQGRTLLALGRVMYPHRRLPDAVYALLVKALDEKAGADALAREQLAEGITALDKAAGGHFVSASPDIQQRCTKAIEGRPFFELVRSQCITTLYNNEMSFALFGYPGSSWQLGGYLKRGFQDLDWLPSPPAEASPPLSEVDSKAAHHGVEVEAEAAAASVFTSSVAAAAGAEGGVETGQVAAPLSTLSSSLAFHRYGG
ncbi:MAG: tat (twin-arginine translocation) pathway signal sequence [Lautropia sp.]|nr:tat (twin-arginine translocation) pathway signal sequence [Lautropia sp.]